MMNRELLGAIGKRRTIYAIGDRITVPEQEIEEMIGYAVLHCPSAFNMQSSRAAILFGADHRELWDLVFQQLESSLSPEQVPNTRKKLGGFKAGYGTVLFFDDTSTVAEMQRRYAAYAGSFATWAQQANGMLQYACWTLLADVGLGVSLQHYNPVIDEAVKRRWDFPAYWSLIAQMPFGSRESGADPKDFLPLEERLRVAGR